MLRETWPPSVGAGGGGVVKGFRVLGNPIVWYVLDFIWVLFRAPFKDPFVGSFQGSL